MNIYDFQTVKDQISIPRYLTDRGIKICDNRFPATWRGSTDLNCSISQDGKVYCDHARGQSGGSVIDLAIAIEHIATPFHAAQCLGDRYHLTPKSTTTLRAEPEADKEKQTHYQRLLSQGYSLSNTYVYTDENGVELYSVLKLINKSTGEKTFLQRTADHWGLKNTRRVLYNLPALLSATTIHIVEGEKDADTLNAIGLTATTNNGGAKNWSEDFNRFFQAKHVVILYDNDQPGIDHAKEIIRQINDIASSIKVLCPSRLPKGDVTDYLTKEGGTKDSLLYMIQATPFYDRKAASAQIAKYTIEEARELNKTPFSNFTIEQDITPSGKQKEVETPKNPIALIQELRSRFLDFPRRLGQNTLFDLDLKTNEINLLPSPDTLFAWISLKSKHPIEWSRIRGAISQAQFYQALLLSVRAYEGVSKAPHFPLRQDIFYSHTPLPQITPGDTSTIDNLVSRFAPASDDYIPLLRAIIFAPIFYAPSAPRPAWVIDSIDGKGTGKTTLVKLIAHLYCETPVDLDASAIKYDFTATVRRLISSEGRSKRIALLDNIQGTFASANLARLITAETISGIAPYGRSEETRQNDLTYIITSNAASLDDDIAQRAFTIKIKKAPRSSTWERDIRSFINLNRETLFAEIISTLQHPPFTITNPGTRYPEFESTILAPACRTLDEYKKTLSLIYASSAENNATEERAQEIQDVFTDAIASILRTVQGSATNRPTFLTTAAISKILLDSDTLRIEHITKSALYEMIQSGNLKCFSKKCRIIKTAGASKRGLLFIGNPIVENLNFINIIEVEKDALVYRCAQPFNGDFL